LVLHTEIHYFFGDLLHFMEQFNCVLFDLYVEFRTWPPHKVQFPLPNRFSAVGPWLVEGAYIQSDLWSDSHNSFGKFGR
jgi:hypothetical protein